MNNKHETPSPLLQKKIQMTKIELIVIFTNNTSHANHWLLRKEIRDLSLPLVMQLIYFTVFENSLHQEATP